MIDKVKASLVRTILKGGTKFKSKVQSQPAFSSFKLVFNLNV